MVGRETLPKAPTLNLAKPQLNARKRGVRTATRAQSVAEVERPALTQNASKKATSSFIVGTLIALLGQMCMPWELNQRSNAECPPILQAHVPPGTPIVPPQV